MFTLEDFTSSEPPQITYQLMFASFPGKTASRFHGKMIKKKTFKMTRLHPGTMAEMTKSFRPNSCAAAGPMRKKGVNQKT